MKWIGLVVGIFLVAICHGDPHRSIEKMTLVKLQPGYQSKYHALKGLRHCGGPARVIEGSIDACPGHIPCTLEANESLLHSEFQFIPSENVERVGLRIILTTSGGIHKILYDKPLEGLVIQGEKYAIMGDFKVISDLKGQTGTTKYIVYREGNGEFETCVEMDYIFT